MRDANGRFLPGNAANLSGRPRGSAGVARRILEQTRDGDELVEFALSVFRDGERDHEERVAMHGWLSDRCLGRPTSTHDLTVSNGTEQEPERDWSKLSVEELRLFAELNRKSLTAGDDRDDLSSTPHKDGPTVPSTVGTAETPSTSEANYQPPATDDA